MLSKFFNHLITIRPTEDYSLRASREVMRADVVRIRRRSFACLESGDFGFGAGDGGDELDGCRRREFGEALKDLLVRLRHTFVLWLETCGHSATHGTTQAE